MYDYFNEKFETEFQQVCVLKKTEAKSVVHVVHPGTGAHFVVRRFQGNPEGYERLLGLKHPNLPQVFEVAEKDGSVIVLEEYIEGDKVEDMLEEACFSPAEVKRIALDLCQALYALHERNIIHRDVKPEHVILRGDKALLVDLDASRLRKEEQVTDTTMLGTIGFAAPEQYGITQSDGRTDIYAMGVTMNLMLTGEHPSVKLAPGRFGRIISRCTMVHPDKRYRDIRHLMEAIA